MRHADSPGSSSSCPPTTPPGRSSGRTRTSPTTSSTTIILVDDVSRDETVDIAPQLGLDVIIHRQNLGYGGNQKTCYDAALEWGADVVVMLHPDYQYDATRIPQLVAPILAGDARPDARQPVPGRPAGGRHAELEVRLQPVPDRRREPRVRAPPVRVPHGPARLQPAAARDDPVPASTATTSCSTRSSSPRSWRPGGAADRRDRRARRATSRRRAPSASSGASSTGCRRCASSPATCSTGPGSAGRRSCAPRASASEPGSGLSVRPPARGPGSRDPGDRDLDRRPGPRRPVRGRRRGLGDAADADPGWVALLVVFVAVDILLRAVRWRVLLAPIARGPVQATSSRSLLVGYLANNILPARLGEIVRSHDLGERTGLSRSTILGTIVVERVVDTVVVVAIASVAILVLSVRGIVASAVLVGLASDRAARRRHRRGHRGPPAARRGARRTGTSHRWPRVRVVAGPPARGPGDREGRAHDGRRGAACRSASWSCTVLAFAAAAQAVGVEPTMGQAALLAAGTNLATAIPAGARVRGHVRAGGGDDRGVRGHRPRGRARVRDPRPRDDAADHVGRRGDRVRARPAERRGTARRGVEDNERTTDPAAAAVRWRRR